MIVGNCNYNNSAGNDDEKDIAVEVIIMNKIQI